MYSFPHTVGIWCDLLGDLQWWQDALLWCQSSGPAKNAGEWVQNGHTQQLSMH